MRSRTIGALCIFAVLWLVGCFKSVSYDTDYVLKPTVQIDNNGPVTSLPGVKAYAFAADTAAWTVASYEDALAGILTSKRNAADKITTPLAVSELLGQIDTIPASVDWLCMSLDLPSVMVVAVSPEYKLYAFRQQALAENLSPIYASIPFQLWRTSYRIAVGPWIYVNEVFAPDVSIEFELLLKPFNKALETMAPEPYPGVEAYAYAVDSTNWRVASYEDAVAGILTSKSDPAKQKSEPDVRGIPEGDQGWLRMNSAELSLMIVAYDPQHKIYAYTQQPLTWYAPVELPLVFEPWKQEYRYADENWIMVDDSLKPIPNDPDTPDDDPDTPNDPDTPEPAGKVKR